MTRPNRVAGEAGLRRATRRVAAQDLRELLEAAPRANVAFRSGDGVQAAPVAFRFQAGRYWIGVPTTEAGPMLGPGEVVKLLIDEGRWFFQLRGLWVRGHTMAADRVPEGAAGSLAWLELRPEKVVAWDYGRLREVADDGA
jgi:hypothetical protein